MAAMEREHGVTRWIADPSGKEQIEKLRNTGFRVQAARHGNKIPLRVQIMASRLTVVEGLKEPGMYFTPDCPNLIRETETLMYQEPKAGSTEYHSDKFASGLDDHAVDALTNALSDIDAMPVPPKRQTEPEFWWDRSF